MAVTIDHMEHFGGIFHRKFQVVLHGKDGDALLLIERSHERVQLQLAFHVDAGGGLVENEKIRLAHEGPRDEHLLALPAGQAPHELVPEAVHVHLIQRAADNVPVLQAEDSPLAVHHLLHGDGKLPVQRVEALGHIGAVPERIGDGAAVWLEKP